ncbi:MAG: hypothetical protein KDK70_42115 [Myxococcales bacterium]|nr:hypothetical protein [Myxococcales bacterium]
MNEISARLLSHSLLAWSLNGLSGCDGWCIGECASPGNADEGNGTSNPSGPGDSGDGADDTGGEGGMIPDLCSYPALAGLGSEVLVVDGKDVLKVDHLVPDPTAPTTFVQVVWFVELCDPYVFIIDGQLGGAITRSDPGGTIEDSDPGGFFKVIIGMGAVTYDGAS